MPMSFSRLPATALELVVIGDSGTAVHVNRRRWFMIREDGVHTRSDVGLLTGGDRSRLQREYLLVSITA